MVRLAPQVHSSFCWHELNLALAFSGKLIESAPAFMIHFAERILRLLGRKDVGGLWKRYPASLPVRKIRD
jgi:hypothetical protein